MSWYKKSNNEIADIQRFFNWISKNVDSWKFNHLIKNIEYGLYRLPTDAPIFTWTMEYWENLIQGIFNLTSKIKSLEDPVFKYLIRENHEAVKTRIMNSIDNVRDLAVSSYNLLSKHKNKLDSIDDDDSYEAARTIEEIRKELWNLWETLKLHIIDTNDLQQQIEVREYLQTDIVNRDENNFQIKYIYPHESPAEGTGWMMFDPATKEWKWFKTNWITY
jgi:hypothetical protein